MKIKVGHSIKDKIPYFLIFRGAKMKRTLFNLSKQVVWARTSSSQQLDFNSIELANLLNSFSSETRNRISNRFVEECYESSFDEIQQCIQKENELITNCEKINPLDSLRAFEKSVNIANIILENYPMESFDSQNKKLLAQAYAGYADVLKKWEPEKIDIRKDLVNKSLELDPKNEMAKELNFDMRFYDIVPEPLRM